MYFWTLAFLGASALWAADDGQLALVLKAQTDFDRVALAAVPQLPETTLCVQSQAAWLAVAGPDEVPLLHFRKGYCALAGAAITGFSGGFTDAASEFDKAIETWPARPRSNTKDKPPEPVSSGLRVLAAVARLEAGADDAGSGRAHDEIAAALAAPVCSPSVMPQDFCQAALDTGRLWLGRIELSRGNLDEAAKNLAATTGSGWQAWVAGRQAFLRRDYREAAAQYRKGVDTWTFARREPASSLTARLSPPPDLASAWRDLGGAQLLAGNPPKAIASLDEAVKQSPSDAQAIYWRGLAREAASQKEQSLADYSLASRTAFANAKDLATGEGHLYRGILLYRRLEYGRAEDEFASALNSEVPARLRADAEAWRHLAAVAAGSCGAARASLEQALASVSPYFPGNEARAAVRSCSSAATAAPVSGVSGK